MKDKGSEPDRSDTVTMSSRLRITEMPSPAGPGKGAGTADICTLQGCSPLAGSVIGVGRGTYDHYGVAAGDGGIIHYTSNRSDIRGNLQVRHTSPQHFLRQSDSFWTMSFPDEQEARRILQARAESVLKRLAPLISGASASPLILAALAVGWRAAIERITADYHLYSPAETLERAFSRMGESRYNVATMNCEHFAFWCRTGLSTSQQVDGFLLGGVSLVSLLMLHLRPNASLDRALNEFAFTNDGTVLFRKSRRMPAALLCRQAGRSRSRPVHRNR